MENWAQEMEKVAKRKKNIESFLKGLAVGGLIGVALLAGGWQEKPHELKVEEYTVQKGDTLWSISERYMAKNTYGRRYILEFKEGIKEENPWLIDTHEQLQIGDKLKITYWVAAEGGDE